MGSHVDGFVNPLSSDPDARLRVTWRPMAGEARVSAGGLALVRGSLTVFTGKPPEKDTGASNRVSWKQCATLPEVHLPNSGYFGLSASTGDLSDMHEVTGLSVRPFLEPTELSTESPAQAVAPSEQQTAGQTAKQTSALGGAEGGAEGGGAESGAEGGVEGAALAFEAARKAQVGKWGRHAGERLARARENSKAEAAEAPDVVQAEAQAAWSAEAEAADHVAAAAKAAEVAAAELESEALMARAEVRLQEARRQEAAAEAAQAEVQATAMSAEAKAKLQAHAEQARSTRAAEASEVPQGSALRWFVRAGALGLAGAVAAKAWEWHRCHSKGPLLPLSRRKDI